MSFSKRFLLFSAKETVTVEHAIIFLLAGRLISLHLSYTLFSSTATNWNLYPCALWEKETFLPFEHSNLIFKLTIPLRSFSPYSCSYFLCFWLGDIYFVLNILLFFFLFFARPDFYVILQHCQKLPTPSGNTNALFEIFWWSSNSKPMYLSSQKSLNFNGVESAAEQDLHTRLCTGKFK